MTWTGRRVETEPVTDAAVQVRPTADPGQPAFRTPLPGEAGRGTGLAAGWPPPPAMDCQVRNQVNGQRVYALVHKGVPNVVALQRDQHPSPLTSAEHKPE